MPKVCSQDKPYSAAAPGWNNNNPRCDVTFHAHKLDCVNVLKGPASKDAKNPETIVQMKM